LLKHDEAAAVLDRVDKDLGSALRCLTRLKTKAQYADDWLTDSSRKAALRCADDDGDRRAVAGDGSLIRGLNDRRGGVWHALPPVGPSAALA